MKKLILLALICMSCNTQTDFKTAQRGSNKWIIESKHTPVFMVGYTFKVSNVENINNIKTVEVGKYTYDKMEVGDTITLNIQ